MVEKIVFDRNLIRQIVNDKNVSLLFIKYDPVNKKAFYRTDTCKQYVPIYFEKIKNI
ncbi:MAG: hypothetical protein PHO63_04390 [Bacilli bacterium]|nr:hypothetical protein [Bacilli bacterium]MDD4809307.1 hypothetical protein [Bacilli bacterium]